MVTSSAVREHDLWQETVVVSHECFWHGEPCLQARNSLSYEAFNVAWLTASIELVVVHEQKLLLGQTLVL